MTTNNLTLDNWIERKAMNIVYQLDDDSGLSIEFRQANNDKRIDFVEQILNELLSLQHQKDIEQFKNMESMRHQSFACKDDCDDKICIKIKTQNQKIDEILKELKTL